LSVIDRAAVLKQVPIYAGLNDQELEALATIAVERSFTTGEYIFWDDDASDWLYTVATGQVKVVKYSSLGKEFIIAFFGPGEILGEVAIFENRPYPASAVAVAPTRLLAIARQDFLDFLENRPEVSLKIIGILGGRLRDAQGRLRDLAGERVEQRLARILLMLVDKIGPSLPFTRQEVADMAGTTTETTIRTLSGLKERGIIGSARGRIHILDPEKLRLIGDGPPGV